MHLFYVLLVWASLIFLPSGQGYTWYKGEQRLSEFQTKYSSSKSDIFFLIDNSGSLWDHRTGRNGFYDEKAFVSSVLSKIKIAKPATRVAIIRFGNDATIDINYVTNLNGLNNKCEFNKAFSQVGYTGVMTNMRGAFLRVKEILFGTHSTNVRPWRDFGKSTNVNKVTFLLTDGRWNNGGDPDDQIKFLKTEHVEIFTIGVTNVDQAFLKQAATSPDRYFYYNEFKDFRELATHIRGDPYQLDYDTELVPKSKCTRTCDTNASCGCGLLSGKYVCICHVGHYGSGFINNCKACAPGTYKDYVGLATKGCTSCPLNSGHNKQGSSRRTDCVCNKGYEGNPGSGRDCTIKRCLALRTPEDGYTNPAQCSQNYGTICAFQCNAGFKLLGEPSLTCSVHDNNVGGAFWSPKATVPECKRIVCPSYRVANAVTESGKCDNSDRRTGTKCNYSCLRGYRLVGSSERVCQSDETWSGQPTKCEVVTCPALNSLTLTKINDRNCIEKPMRFDSKCIFSCPDGYAFNISRQQSLTRVCLDTGKWDGTFQMCKDILAPKFTDCPRDKIFTYNTTSKLNSSEVTWKLPKFEDNSQTIDVNHRVKLTENNNYEPPHIFGIGTHIIGYTVTDKEGLSSFCGFSIKVEDHEAPYYTKCPGKIFKETAKSKERIVWDEPEFVDNSGKDVTITSNRYNSDEFQIGQTMVFYTATDINGNKNTSCAFEVHVKKLGCEQYKTPKNGALLCYNAAGSDMCRAYCKEGFDFGYKPAQLYYCAGGNWNTWPIGVQFKLPWPDCAVRNDPSSGSLKMTSSFYFSGDCNDEEVKLGLKNAFVNTLKNPMVFPPTFCMFQKECQVANVVVHCGETTAARRRRRRGTQKEIYISADYVVKSNAGSSQADFQKLKQDMNSQLLVEATKRAQNINWKSSMNLEQVKKPTIKSSEPYCSGKKGAVIGRCNSLKHDCDQSNFLSCLCNQETGNIEKCIECPIGKFYNVMTSKCEICKDGTFQDVEGQFGCKKCQPGFSTFGNDAKNFTLCREICKPGFYSLTGLAPCYACSRGQYSTDEWGTSCKTCPQGTVTVLAAATKIEDCGMKCAPGTYSSNGVEPCKPCPKGTYQANEGKLSCIPCEGTRSTYGPGAKTISHCIEINECDSNPCNNGAKCKDLKDNYHCICKPGYSGRNCEIEDNECLSNPCYDNAVCVDEVDGYVCVCAKGFTGQNCDEPIPQCNKGNACQNGGKCVDMPGRYDCECKNGYSGQFCEINVDDCASLPCKNGGICRDGIDTFTCTCKPGFSGEQCEINTDECSSDPCKKDGKCVDKVDGYICQCANGFVGLNCEIDYNECAPNPCKNRGKCVNKLGSFECQCAPTFTGKNCEEEQSSDFDLSFPTYEIQTFSKAMLHQDLYAFTLAFWMRTRDMENAGTPVSYSVKRGSYVEENGIVLKDYGNFAIQINNKTGYTSDPVNDGQWHHVAVTWRSSDGIWVYYRDGKEIKRASEPLAKGDFIRGGGEVVLAQEQDWEAAENRFAYNPLEAFLGDMSQLTLWNKVLSDREVYNLAGSCSSAEQDAIVVAWPDFVPGLHGSYKKTEKSHACDVSSPLRQFDTVYKARIPSNDHKTLHGLSAEACAKACEQESSFSCRSFDYNSAAKECILSKAYRETVSIISSNNEKYDYYELSCLDRLGMESGVIRDSQLSSSSSMNIYSGAKEARTNRRKIRNVDGMPDSDGGWIPNAFNKYQYLQIDLGKTVKVTGVETQGADGQSYWVQSYKLLHSENGNHWSTLSQTIYGNSDNKGRVKNQINVRARYIRIAPQTWSGGIGMRVELYGCSLDPEGVPTDLASIKVSHSGSCSPNPCHNGGSCTSLPYGYACKCAIGFTGKICQTALSCDDPGTPTNGYKSSFNYNAGSTVNFGCNNGYALTGSSSRKCSNGQWSGSRPTCSNINECSLHMCNQHCTDFPGSYRCSCVTGYRLASDKRTCKDINECQENVCSHGCINTQGSFRCTCISGMKLGSSKTKCEDTNECASRSDGCEHNCLNTYRSRQCHCKGGYTLNSDGKSCIEIHCPNPVKPVNGFVTIVGDAVLGNSAQYSCTDGFNLVGSDQRICQANGKWSGTQPICQAVRCVDVGNVDYANRQGSRRSYNSGVTFTCQSTYRLIGTPKRTCQKNSIWSNQQPICVPDYCPALTAPAHGHINGFRTELHATVGVSCDTGYKVVGTSFRTCKQSRAWSGSDPTCQMVDCGNPGEPRNGYRHGNYYKYNSTIDFTCKSKHHLEGAREIKCKANGKWSSEIPKCLARSCGNPGVPYNGFKHGSSHTYGSAVQYTCQKGYTLLGNRRRTCEESTAKWTGSLPRCQLVNCGNHPTLVHGFQIGEKFTYNEVLRFDCDPGYKLVGSNYRRCQASGVWSGATPSCVKTSCGSFMHGPNGVVESPNFPNVYENDLYCTWDIKVPTGKQVRIEFTEFKTEGSNDFLYIFDTGKTDPIISFSGVSYKPLPLTSSGNSMRIRFVSNGAINSNGFRLQYSQVDCGGMFVEPKEVISSPNYKGQYPNKIDCSWLVHIPNKKIGIGFSDFNTQRSYDRLTIYDGPYSNMKRKFDWSGTLVPYGQIVTKNYMYLRFTSSSSNDRSYNGFKAQYEEYLYYDKKRSVLTT